MKNLKLLALLAVMPLCSFGELKYLDQSEAEEQMQRAMENPNLEGEYCKGTQKTKHKFIENIEGKIEQVLAESYAEDDPSRIPNEMLPDLGLHVWVLWEPCKKESKKEQEPHK